MMAGLTVGARAMLAQLIETIPDEDLSVIRATVTRLNGDKAFELAAMLDDTLDDRRRRSVAFRALIPLFRPRKDGLRLLSFPAFVLPRLWRAVADRDPALLAKLDNPNDENASRRALARMRLYVYAAEIVRERPEDIWPVLAASDIEGRGSGLVELAHCLDMGMLAHRATRRLLDWVVHPDEDRLVEFRLMVRDAAATDVDGVRRLLEIMAAHIDDATLVLRLAVHALGGASGDLLKQSELSAIVEPVLEGFDIRAARIAAFRPGASIEQLRLDLAWCVPVVEALDLVVQADPGGDWARRISGSKAGVVRMMESHLGSAVRTIARALPMRDAQTSGRMTRHVPRLDVAVAATDRDGAANMVDLIAAVRSAASRFGCEAQRQSVVQAVTSDLISHADLTLEALGTGEAPDPALALERAAHVIDLLERIGEETEGHLLRRRVAALSQPAHAHTA